ncbi:unnamed protein product [Sympodiomycopsis kandeliae]
MTDVQVGEASSSSVMANRVDFATSSSPVMTTSADVEMNGNASSSSLPARPLKRKSSPSSSPSHRNDSYAYESRQRTRFVAEGDLVLLFSSRDRPMIPVKVTPGQHYINAYGSFPHDSFIGRPFGSPVRSLNNKGFLTLLRPTPELWTLSLPHRTQILYAPDMSFISTKLGLSPGAKVVEAGTGSGSFTHFLARTVGRVKEWDSESGKEEEEEEVGVPSGRSWQGQDGMGISLPRGKGIQTRPPKASSEEEAAQEEANLPNSSSVQQTPDYDGKVNQFDGKVWTFEFHKERALRAREEFISHNLTPLISSSHRNVCLNGFPISISSQADAVFLDLPAPWEAIPHTLSVLNPGQTTRICCFSPCIEQVLRTVKALNENGFKDVEMYECLNRSHESLKPSVMEMPLKRIESVQDKLKNVLDKKEKISNWQRMRSKERKEGATATKVEADEEGDDHKEGESKIEEQNNDTRGGKQAKVQQPAHFPPPNSSPPSPVLVPIGIEFKQQQYMIRSNIYSRAHPQMRGHTSYLTFASLLPRQS